MNNRAKHFTIAIVTALTIYAMGVAGYMLIEKWNFLDSVYMTAITLSTVGYSEINIVSSKGRYFTMILIFAGCGYFLYLAGVVMQFVVEGEIRSLLGRRKKEKAIQIDESMVSANPELTNVMLKDSGIRQNYNIIIIAIKKADGRMSFNPSFETYIREGDTVIAMGRKKSLQRFNKILNSV